MHVIFTDLDGTLLDHETYSYGAAAPALDRLRRAKVPIVFTTSKTRAEIEPLRKHMENAHPFISENGGAAFVPLSYFPFEPSGARRIGNYDVIEYGDRYEELVTVLREAARSTGCNVRAFSGLTAAEIAALSGLPLEEAERAKAREFDEPFEVLDLPDARARLLAEIKRRGKKWTLGGRFYHIIGDSNKAEAVRALSGFYRQAHGQIVTVGLGDGWNDVQFLNVVDIPILVRSPSTEKMQAAVPGGRITAACGPQGWNEAISEMFPE